MATPKQKQAAKAIAENLKNPKPKPLGEVLKNVGYSEKTSLKPKLVTDSKGFQELMEKYLPDEGLMEVHKNLLNSHRIEHMVFPLMITDDEIHELLESSNCKVRKIAHGETAIHCWFWSPDAAAQKAAVELAYKIKGRITNKIDANVTTDAPIALVRWFDGDGSNSATS